MESQTKSDTKGKTNLITMNL